MKSNREISSMSNKIIEEFEDNEFSIADVYAVLGMVRLWFEKHKKLPKSENGW